MPWRKELITTKAHDFQRIPVSFDSICKYFLPAHCSRIIITGINTTKTEKGIKTKRKIHLLFKRFLSISSGIMFVTFTFLFFFFFVLPLLFFISPAYPLLFLQSISVLHVRMILLFILLLLGFFLFFDNYFVDFLFDRLIYLCFALCSLFCSLRSNSLPK
jgi:hypothetical protein